MFDPLTIGIGALVWLVFKKQDKTQHGILTPERDEVYRNAMEYLKPPERLRELAKEFEKNGLKSQAFLLNKRAEWRARPDAVKKQHEAIFVKALQSKNIEGILEVAKIFEGMTASIKAAQLRERARSLHEAAQRKADAAAVPTTAETPAESQVQEVKTEVFNGMSGHTPETKDPQDPQPAAQA